MANKELLYIQDSHKRKLYYRFTPAAIVSNFVPLVVILHDEGVTDAPNFEYKMWNVLTPIDNFGHENRGSCWLGEEGDFFVKDLLQELITFISEEHECEEHIYLYGSGMGAYGAILHGMLCGANAVYTRKPLIKLNETSHTDSSKKSFYGAIFSQTIVKENNLSNFLNPRDSFPIFFLCDYEDADASNEAGEVNSFIDICTQHKLKVRLDGCIKFKDDEISHIKETLNMLERMSSAE